MREINTALLTELSIQHEGKCKDSDKELLKVYDKNGNYVGESTRLLCHRLGLFHEVINCFIVDSQLNVLLQHRKDIISETFDLSIGGHVDCEDASIESALMREAVEELNISLDPHKIKNIAKYKRERYTNIYKPREVNNEIRHLFYYSINDEEKFQLELNFEQRKKSEAESFVWMTIDEIIQIIAQGNVFDGLQYSFYFFMRWLMEDNLCNKK